MAEDQPNTPVGTTISLLASSIFSNLLQLEFNSKCYCSISFQQVSFSSHLKTKSEHFDTSWPPGGRSVLAQSRYTTIEVVDVLVPATNSYSSGRFMDTFLNIFSEVVGFISLKGSLPCNTDCTALIKSPTC